jgi:hypothetical protein
MVIAGQTLACYELAFINTCTQGTGKYNASASVVAIS